MESHGDERFHPAQNDDSGSFGVKVQVQGINGRPYVVLNAQDVPEYPDVFVMEDQQQGLLSYMSGSASSIQTSLRNNQNPERSLRPFDLRNIHHRGQSGGVWFSSPPSPVNASPVMVKRARIPLPGAEAEVENVPCRTSRIICRPASGDDLELKSRESPPVGHRSRMTPDDKRRSRSAESRLTEIEMEAESSTEVTEVRSAGSTERSKVKGTEKSSAREAQVENVQTM